MIMLSNYFDLAVGEVLIGFGAFCSWVSITKYLANTKNFYIIMRTFQKAVPLITKVWIGIAPIYIGLCFLSITICWNFPVYFGSFGRGLFTLFSLQAGDQVHDMWAGMANGNFFYGQLFGYCWVFFACAIVQNIFMVIVEDAYISTKYSKNFEWLYSDG